MELISLATLVAVDPSPVAETVASLQWSGRVWRRWLQWIVCGADESGDGDVGGSDTSTSTETVALHCSGAGESGDGVGRGSAVGDDWISLTAAVVHRSTQTQTVASLPYSR